MAKYVLYPRRTIDYCKPYHFIRKEKDYGGFFCPHCFNPMVFRLSVTMNIQNIDKDAEYYISMTPQYNIQCTKCKELLHFDYVLDPNITPILAELNRKGYETVESCEGHRVNQQDVSLPYITFKYPGQRNVVKYIALQGPWYLDENEDKFIIRCKDMSVPIRERMAYLRKWVNALPYCFEENFTEDLFTEETQASIAYQLLNAPLLPEDITSREEAIAFDEDTDAIVMTDENQNTGKKTYSSKDEIKHRNDPDYEPPRREFFNPNKAPKQPSYGHGGYGYNKPKYNNSSNGGRNSRGKKSSYNKNPSGKVSTYTNKQKKDKPVWNPETGKQEYKR